MKSATSLTHPSTSLSGFQFSMLNVLKSLIPKDQKKYINTGDEVGATFYSRHTALNILSCEYKISGDFIYNTCINKTKETMDGIK